MNPEHIADLTLRDLIEIYVDGDTPVPPELSEWIECARKYKDLLEQRKRNEEQVSFESVGLDLIAAFDAGKEALGNETPALTAKLYAMVAEGAKPEDLEPEIQNLIDRVMGVIGETFRRAPDHDLRSATSADEGEPHDR